MSDSKRVTFDLPTGLYAELKAEADNNGHTLAGWVRFLVLIGRQNAHKMVANNGGKPGTQGAKRPVGRPRLTANERRFNYLINVLEGIYGKHRTWWAETPGRFNEIFGAQLAQLEEIKNSQDLDALENFNRAQPWTQWQATETEEEVKTRIVNITRSL